MAGAEPNCLAPRGYGHELTKSCTKHLTPGDRLARIFADMANYRNALRKGRPRLSGTTPARAAPTTRDEPGRPVRGHGDLGQHVVAPRVRPTPTEPRAVASHRASPPRAAGRTSRRPGDWRPAYSRAAVYPQREDILAFDTRIRRSAGV